MVFGFWERLFENILKRYWIWLQGFHYKWFINLDMVWILSPVFIIMELIVNVEHWFFLIYLWLDHSLHSREITSSDLILGDIYLILLNINWLNVFSFPNSRKR